MFTNQIDGMFNELSLIMAIYRVAKKECNNFDS